MPPPDSGGLPSPNSGGVGLPPPVPAPIPAPIPGGGGLPPPIPTTPTPPTAPTTVVAATAPDEYAKYRKMLKMNIPFLAVLNKMKQSGVAQAVLQKFELTGELPPPPSGGAAPAAASPTPNDGLDKYRKMIKMNIPKAAVVNKMKQSGVDKAIIQKYELTGELPAGGGGGSAPAPAPDDGLDKFRKMIKMNIPKAAVVNKMKQSGVDRAIIQKYELTGQLSAGGGLFYFFVLFRFIFIYMS